MRSGNNFGNNCRGRGRGGAVLSGCGRPLIAYLRHCYTHMHIQQNILKALSVRFLPGNSLLWGGGGVKWSFRVHKRPPLDPTLIQNTTVHYKNSDAQFLTKVLEEMVSFGSQISVTLTCCSLQFADLIVKLQTLYCEHFLSYRFKCWYDYCHTCSKRNILYTPSFNIPSLTWNIALANKEVTIACLLLC